MGLSGGSLILMKSPTTNGCPMQWSGLQIAAAASLQALLITFSLTCLQKTKNQ
jgi:hypothetical protein